MKKIKFLIPIVALLAMNFNVFAQGLPPTYGCYLVAEPEPGQASVYECEDGSLEIRSTLRFNGACSGSEYDCISDY